METGSSKQRLNPLFFPPETNIRFLLVVVAAIVAMWTLGIRLLHFFGIYSPASFEVFNAFNNGMAAALTSPENLQAFSAQMVPLFFQHLVDFLPWVVIPFGITLLPLSFAISIYILHPGIIRRWTKLRPITASEDHLLLNMVQKLSTVAGVVPAPSVDVDPNPGSVDGQAFGLRQRYIIRLGGRMRLLLRKVPAGFRAILLHELAHIANRDIHRTYLSIALWVTVALFSGLFLLLFYANAVLSHLNGIIVTPEQTPIIVDHFLSVSVPILFSTTFQASIVFVIVTIMLGGLLRIREMYADWLTSHWGEESSLVKMLERQAEKESKGRVRFRFWHPLARQRLDILRDPGRLFRLTMDVPFLSAFLMAHVLEGSRWISPYLMQVFGGTLGITVFGALNPIIQLPAVFQLLALLVMFVMVFIVVTIALTLGTSFLPITIYIIAGTVGLQVQRESIADLAIRRSGILPYLHLWIPAGLIAAGMQAGFLTTLWNPNRYGLLWFVIVACLTWLWLIYARFYSIRFFGTRTGLSAPDRERRLLTLLIIFLIAILYIPIIDPPWGPNAIPLVTTLGVQFILYIIMFTATGLLLQVRRRMTKSTCASCKQVTLQTYTIGQRCEHCGQDLAPWLYSDSIHQKSTL